MRNKFEYNGVCKKCCRRRNCPKAQLQLDLEQCNALKIKRQRKEKD